MDPAGPTEGRLPQTADGLASPDHISGEGSQDPRPSSLRGLGLPFGSPVRSRKEITYTSYFVITCGEIS